MRISDLVLYFALSLLTLDHLEARPIMFLVENVESIDLKAFFRKATITGFEGLSGHSIDKLKKKAPALLDQPENFIDSYKFVEGSIIIDLDLDRIERSLRDNNIFVWGVKRPSVLVWISTESNFKRNFISETIFPENEFDLALREAMQRWDILIKRPVMDLEDTVSLTADELWKSFSSSILNASLRYNSDLVLTIADMEIDKTSRWVLYDNEKIIASGQVKSETVAERVNILITKIIEKIVKNDMENERESVPVTSADTANYQIIILNVVKQQRLLPFLNYLEKTLKDVAILRMEMESDRVKLFVKTDLNNFKFEQLILGYSDILIGESGIYSFSSRETDE